MSGDPGEQLALLQARVRPTRARRPEPPAEVDPVAQVVVDVGLAHLDRSFDYAVPQSMASEAVPGVRVRVRFAGRLVDGWVVSRSATAEEDRALSRLSRVVSASAVLTPATLELSRAVAARYAGTLPDVLRAAVPPRHARTEAAVLAEPVAALPIAAPAAGSDGPAGALVAGPAGTGPRRTAWTATPGQDWAPVLAQAAATTAAAGRGAVLVVPDARDVARLDAAMTAAVGAGRHVVLSAEQSPAARYRAFLAAWRGQVRIVLGTRAAAFAPVPDLGLLALWDDGDDSLAEPRAPYWHAREVLSLRSQLAGCSLVVGSYGRSVDVARAVETGWLTDLTPSRAALRAAAPRVRAVGGDSATGAELARDPAARTARLPHTAFEVARAALAHGPVLVQVPRRGYLPGLACRSCRTPARCGRCGGPLQLAGAGADPQCGWCATPAPDWRCPQCGGAGLRATATGAGRTAEELGRAFPGVPVVRSGREGGGTGVLDTVPARPALVVATPGAEPVAAGGYAAALLLDGRLLLDRAVLRAGEEAARRWFSAAALVRGAPAGGSVVVLAESDHPVVQALVRWDPAGLAERELAARRQANLPPAARVAELVGEGADVADLLAQSTLPGSAQVLGPVPLDADPGPPAAAPAAQPAGPGRRRGRSAASGASALDLPAEPSSAGRVRALVVAPLRDGAALAAALHAGAGLRSARRSGGPVTVRIDPVDLG